MSRTTVYAIDHRNRFDEIGDVPNTHAFHVAIWEHLGHAHYGWPDGYRAAADARLETLWGAIKTLPRAHGLAMAATFDRCWFPIDLREETIDALAEIAPHASAARAVAGQLIVAPRSAS